MRSVALGILLLAGAGDIAAQSREGPRAAAINREIWLGLDSAYQQGREAGDLSLLKVELGRLFASMGDTSRLGLNWIGRHLDSFTHAEQEELYRVYIELHPSDRTTASLRDTIAANRLEDAPKEERAALYWAAVRNGKARIPGGADLVRSVALGMAAADGLEEFRAALTRFSSEINKAHPRSGYDESAYLLILLVFRAGAPDRAHANRLHAERLLELGDQQFFERMNSDTAFREATDGLASRACRNWQAPECLNRARLYARQREHQAKFREADSQTPAHPLPRSPDGELLWMSRLRAVTGGAGTLLLKRPKVSKKIEE